MSLPSKFRPVKLAKESARKAVAPHLAALAILSTNGMCFNQTTAFWKQVQTWKEQISRTEFPEEKQEIAQRRQALQQSVPTWAATKASAQVGSRMDSVPPTVELPWSIIAAWLVAFAHPTANRWEYTELDVL